MITDVRTNDGALSLIKAENVLHVSGKRDNTYPPTLLHCEIQALSEGRIVEFDPSERAKLRGPGKWLVSCGEQHSKDSQWWPGMKIQSGTVLVVNPTTLEECSDGMVGELWITGKCVTAGYWNSASSTSSAYSARLHSSKTEDGLKHLKSSFYRTGDLGVFYHGDLYITGRLKEMIIVNGTKHYPMDIEESIRLATENGIRVNGGASGGGAKPSSSSTSSVSTLKDSSISGPSSIIHIRPGGILATEMENVSTGKNELIVMVECMEPMKINNDKTSSSSVPPPPSSSSSSSSDGKMSSSQVALANTIFKQCQRLPTFLRTPTIKCLARLGARYVKYKREQANGTTPSSSASSSDLKDSKDAGSSSIGPFTSHELDTIEKSIRRAVMGRFGIPVADIILLRPRSILKTSSGKIRRNATSSLLMEGELKDKILRRSSEKKGGTTATSAAAQQWIAKPTVQTTLEENHTSSSTHQQKSITNTKKSVQTPISPNRNDSDFELVSSSSPLASSSSSLSVSSSSPSSSSPPLDFDTVKLRVSTILGEELNLDSDTILMLSQTFEFEDGTTLDEYGLDSLTAMKIAGRLSQEFELLIPISPFMFFNEPTLDGIVKLVIRLKNEMVHGKKISSAKDFKATTTTAAATNLAKCQANAKRSVMKSSESDTNSNKDVLVERSDANSLSPSSSSSSPSSSSSSSSSSIVGSSSFPFILGLGCCVPGPGAPQAAIMDIMVTHKQENIQP